MIEPRRIVLILGNGFDIDLGLNTSYKDFYKSGECPQYYPAPIIYYLNQSLQDRLDSVRWYDLENALHEYYDALKDTHKGDEFLTEEELTLIKDFSYANWLFGRYNDQENILQSLVNKKVLHYEPGKRPDMWIDYQKECFLDPIIRDKKALEMIKEGLCRYLKTLTLPDLNQRDSVAANVLFAMSVAARTGASVDVYSFNYTILPIKYYRLKGRLHHMHGRVDDGQIVIGTRDDAGMSKEYFFLQKAMASFNSPDIVTALTNATEVIFFGHSLGENDRQYFLPFFKKQTGVENISRKSITIFTKDEDSRTDIKWALQKITDGNLSLLQSINHPVIIRTEELESDKELFYQFLMNHGFTEEMAGEAMGKIRNAKTKKPANG